MLLKFLGKTIQEYKGADGKGNIIHLKAGDMADVDLTIGKLLLTRYRHDFEACIAEEAKPEHKPRSDKQLKKKAEFKGK